MYNILAYSPVFRGISPQDIEALLKQVTFQVKVFEKEQLIAQRGQELKSFCILIEGQVRGEMLDPSGKTLKVEDIEAPRPIAIGFLFGQNNHYPVDVIANTQVKILVLPIESVVKILQNNATVLRNFLNAISNRAQFLSQRIWFLSFKTIKGKLAQYILSTAGNVKNTIELPLTQQELADYFGVTRPSLARALGDMERDELISVNRKTITILNRAALNKLIE